MTSPVSDGGEGILEVLVEAKHGEIIETRVSGPLGVPVTAKWGMIKDKGSTGGRYLTSDCYCRGKHQARALRLRSPH